MIYPRRYDDRPHLGVTNPNKIKILEFMKAQNTDSICEGYVTNLKTGEVDKRFVDAEYEHGDVCWYGEDTYNFEYNDMELSPEFCDRVMELIGQA